MAIGLDSGGVGSRRSRGARPLSDINVTPFVDVLLVLLVIFMLTVNVMEFGIEIEVPKVRAVSTDTTKELPVISITREGNVFLNEKPVRLEELPGIIRTRFKNPKAVYLRADKQTTYDPIAQVLSVLGEEKIGVNMVTKPDETRRP